MFRSRYLLIFLLAGLFTACGSSKFTTIYKPDIERPATFKKVLVAAISGEQLPDSIRQRLEINTVDALAQKGYTGISYFNEFGKSGIELFGEEAAYLFLCEQGVDAVLTVAMVDEKKSLRHPATPKYTSRYYYDRIWSYKGISQQQTSIANPVWEVVLFDLASLEPRGVIVADTKEIPLPDLSVALVNKMTKEKMLRTQKKSTLKAF
jgi:hypothetical protein